MKQKIIINDIPFVLDLIFMDLEHILIDVTCVGDSWRNYISSGIRFINLEGIDGDGEKIAGKFQIIDKTDDTFVLKSIRE